MNLLYFDPGLGAMIIQGLVAIVSGVLLFYKSIAFKVKTFFGVNNGPSEYGSIDIELDSDEKKEE